MAGQLAPPAAAAVPPCPLHTPPPAPQVMEAAAGNLTPVVLELGGKDAFVVCDDADLNQVGAHALNPLCCGSHASLPSAPSLPPARPPSPARAGACCTLPTALPSWRLIPVPSTSCACAKSLHSVAAPRLAASPPAVLALGCPAPAAAGPPPRPPQVLPTALRGAFQSCGQNCAGAERFIVQERVYDEFVR